MRIRNKRRKHYGKHGWKKFIDSYLKFNYEFTYSEPYAVNGQLMMDVSVSGKNTGVRGRRADIAIIDDQIAQYMAVDRYNKGDD